MLPLLDQFGIEFYGILPHEIMDHAELLLIHDQVPNGIDESISLTRIGLL
jgi:hypothetical protein